MNKKNSAMNTLVVCLKGEIDHHVSAKIREEIDKEIEISKINKLVFDFTKVSFMDSSGIGILLGRYKKLSPMGGKIIIKNANKTVKQILEMSGIFSLMEYEEDEEVY